MNFRKMLIGNARKAMLDNITALDKKTLQRELESHLKLEFEYKDEIERLNNNWEELEKYLEEQSLYGFPTECGIYRTILNKLKELKGSDK